MTFVSFLMGLASNYTVHMIFWGSLIGMAYVHTVYYFECYNPSLLWETFDTLNTIL